MNPEKQQTVLTVPQRDKIIQLIDDCINSSEFALKNYKNKIEKTFYGPKQGSSFLIPKQILAIDRAKSTFQLSPRSRNFNKISSQKKNKKTDFGFRS